jgi:hypothetical protein
MTMALTTGSERIESRRTSPSLNAFSFSLSTVSTPSRLPADITGQAISERISWMPEAM